MKMSLHPLLVMFFFRRDEAKYKFLVKKFYFAIFHSLKFFFLTHSGHLRTRKNISAYLCIVASPPYAGTPF